MRVCCQSTLFVMAFALFFSSCQPHGSQPSTPAEGKKFLFTFVIYGSPGNPTWTKVVAGAREAADALGCTVDIQYAQDDPVRQNDIIETAIGNRTDGVAISLNLDDAYDVTVKKARDLRIPVIAFNNDDSQGAAGNARMAFIGQNEEAAGYVIAKRLIEVYQLKSGDHVVCPVEYPEAVYAILRYRGVRRAFEEVGISSEVLGTGAVSHEDNLNRLTQYLLGHTETDAILAMGGYPMSVAPQAAADVGRAGLPNAGFDITQAIARNIAEGKTLATVDQKPFYQGFFSVSQLYHYKKYGLEPCDINTGGGLIDKDNIAKVMELSDSIR